MNLMEKYLNKEEILVFLTFTDKEENGLRPKIAG